MWPPSVVNLWQTSRRRRWETPVTKVITIGVGHGPIESEEMLLEATNLTWMDSLVRHTEHDCGKKSLAEVEGDICGHNINYCHCQHFNWTGNIY